MKSGTAQEETMPPGNEDRSSPVPRLGWFRPRWGQTKFLDQGVKRDSFLGKRKPNPKSPRLFGKGGMGWGASRWECGSYVR